MSVQAAELAARLGIRSPSLYNHIDDSFELMIDFLVAGARSQGPLLSP